MFALYQDRHRRTQQQTIAYWFHRLIKFERLLGGFLIRLR